MNQKTLAPAGADSEHGDVDVETAPPKSLTPPRTTAPVRMNKDMVGLSEFDATSQAVTRAHHAAEHIPGPFYQPTL